MREDGNDQRVVIAMSGGVDSSAAALLLCDRGYSVIGVSMQVWDYRKNGGQASRATCCAPSDFEDARQIADTRGFPFYVFDFEDSFRQSVIDPFVKSYLRGYTPNPCLDCNRKVKFRELRSRARSLGAEKVATGHYAQIKRDSEGQYCLCPAVDKEKDQSYFLYAMTQEDLAATIWPVGAMNKSEVREYLAERGFTMSSKPESQDICFVSGKVADFVKRYSGTETTPGPIVSRSGAALGTHSGVCGYTVGQRRGLGISSNNPLYVLDIDAESNRVVVGEKDELARENFMVDDLNWVSGKAPEQPITALVKVRYRHPGVKCRIEPCRESDSRSSKCLVSFLDHWTAVSPGQAAVFYEEGVDGLGRVLGGGIIQKDGDSRHGQYDA